MADTPPAPAPAQLVLCPRGHRVPGLLAGCTDAQCIADDIADDHRLARLGDL